jgi:hypothetical protein
MPLSIRHQPSVSTPTPTIAVYGDTSRELLFPFSIKKAQMPTQPSMSITERKKSNFANPPSRYVFLHLSNDPRLSFLSCPSVAISSAAARNTNLLDDLLYNGWGQDKEKEKTPLLANCGKCREMLRE